MSGMEQNNPNYATYLKLRRLYMHARCLKSESQQYAIGQFFEEMMTCVDGVRVAALVANPCYELGSIEGKEMFKFLGRALRSPAKGSSEFRTEVARTVLPQILGALNPPTRVSKKVMPSALNFVRMFTGFKLRGNKWSFHGIPENSSDLGFAKMAYDQMQQELPNLAPEFVEEKVDLEQWDNSSLENTRKRSSELLEDNNIGEEIFSVRHSKSVCMDFKELWKSKKFCDVVFKCSDGQVYAHKCILSARSEILRTMFDDEGGNTNLRKLEAEDTTVAEMDSLLKYLYTGSIKLTKWQNVVNLIKLADKYEFYQLKSDGFDFLVKKMNLSNTGQLVKLAYDYQAPDEAKLKIQEYVISMRAKLAEVPEYQEIVGENPTALTTLMLGKFTNE